MQAIEAGSVTLTDRRTERSWTVEVAPFLLSDRHLTQGTYAEATGRPAAGDPSLPAVNVSWLDAVRCCNALSERDGLAPAYRGGPLEAGTLESGARDGAVAPTAAESGSERIAWDRSADGYRLPAEAEWEHACRAGTTGPRYGELDRIAWYRGNSGERLHRGGGRLPNPWGLYDMIGNAWEWCFDVYDPEVYRDYRVIKGGGWFDEHWSCRAGVRRRTMPVLEIDDLGFRLARNA
ncbi:formylglycine-generating enzyme family protein [Glycomyces harbinensis]|nr:formylglycine-generating enzyme family protein [Glycomyces harbinensis]